MVHFNPSSREKIARRQREAAAMSAALFMFKKQAEAGDVSDEIIVAHAVLFDVWDKEEIITKNCIRLCPENGELFRNIKLPDPRTRTEPKSPSKAAEQWEAIGGKAKSIEAVN